MIETKNPEINVERLLQKIQREVAGRKADHFLDMQTQRLDSLPSDFSTVNWVQISNHLTIAEQNAEIGGKNLPMLRFRRSIRWVARMTSRLVIYLAQVFTIHQRTYNQSILQSLKLMTEGLHREQQQSKQMAQQVKKLGSMMAEHNAQVARLNYSLEKLTEKSGQLSRQIKDSKAILAEHSGRIARHENLLDITAQNSTEPELDLDDLYVSFEDQFRGDRADIRERFKVYLPIVKETGAGIAERPILDIGCGRGEWLELLKDEGLNAQGVDLNRDMVEQCRISGYRIHENDAIDFLKTVPKEAFGAVTGFHIIEHLPFHRLIVLLNETRRVLKSGGLAIFETPNPQNLLVGASDFWADYTHLRPLFPGTQQFLMEQFGYCRVRLMFLHPVAADQRLPDNEAPQLAQRLNDLLACARDYAVIGYKP